MTIQRIDHLVLTVHNLQATCMFYADVLGMEVVISDKGRVALQFGQQKINLHQVGQEFEPKARQPTPGSADLCLIAAISMDQMIEHLNQCGIPMETDRIQRTGALGSITSIYIRDPDGNLLEISTY
jgi:catechol 2,3-dioxygenase-like lactoylglutathione lyase family enzyme